MSTAEQKTLLVDLAPETWRKADGTGSVFQTVFKIFVANPEELKKQTYVHRDSEYLWAWTWAEFSGQSVEWEFVGYQVRTQVNTKNFSQDTYLIVLVPMFVSGTTVSEETCRAKAEFVTGLLLSCFGKNIAYSKVHESELSLSGKGTTLRSPSFENPYYFGFPRVNEDTFNAVRNISEKIATLPIKEKIRTELSLRWFEAANREKSSVDAFIKYWIALETLAMPDTTNIKPINSALALIYNESFQRIGERFLVGRLATLRGEIVHNGMQAALHGDVLRYMDHLYADILFHLLGVPTAHRAGAYMDSHSRVIETAIQIAT